jgi:signal peptidase II
VQLHVRDECRIKAAEWGVTMFYILIVVAFVVAEYKIKNYIEANIQFGEKHEIMKGKIVVNKHYNKGAFLNFLENKKETVKTVSFICLGLLLLLFTIMLPKKGNKIFKLGLSLVLGGAISNVSDRFLRGYVVDYFSVNCRKLKNIVFNLADFFIFIGSLLIIISTLFSGIFKSGADKASE